MKLNRKSKAVLDVIIKTSPMQNQFYSPKQFYGLKNMSLIELIGILDYLSITGAIKFADNSKTLFTLCELGRSYKEMRWLDLKEFLFKSVAIPIIVAFITAVLVSWLLN